jgi:hypothetical protein
MSEDGFVTRDTWVMNSGADAHIYNNSKWFAELNALYYKVKTANSNTKLRICGGGKVSLLLVVPDALCLIST